MFTIIRELCTKPRSIPQRSRSHLEVEGKLWLKYGDFGIIIMSFVDGIKNPVAYRFTIRRLSVACRPRDLRLKVKVTLGRAGAYFG